MIQGYGLEGRVQELDSFPGDGSLRLSLGAGLVGVVVLTWVDSFGLLAYSFGL